MPHTTIEYSANVAAHHDVDALVLAVHDAALGMELAHIGGYRTRAVAREHFRVADGDPNFGFIAITVRIGPGRSPELKKDIIDTLLDAGEAQLAAQPSPLVIAWSLEVQEIDADFRVNRNHVTTHINDR